VHGKSAGLCVDRTFQVCRGNVCTGMPVSLLAVATCAAGPRPLVAAAAQLRGALKARCRRCLLGQQADVPGCSQAQTLPAPGPRPTSSQGASAHAINSPWPEPCPCPLPPACRSLDYFATTELLLWVGAKKQAFEMFVTPFFNMVEWIQENAFGWKIPRNDNTMPMHEYLANYLPPEHSYSFAQYKYNLDGKVGRGGSGPGAVCCCTQLVQALLCGSCAWQGWDWTSCMLHALTRACLARLPPHGHACTHVCLSGQHACVHAARSFSRQDPSLTPAPHSNQARQHMLCEQPC
jgi:hypothetical protein